MSSVCRLRKTQKHVHWRQRLKDMLLAGGALAISGCATTETGQNGAAVPGVPCGNANPDPCICDRPKASPEAAAACTATTACDAKGGVWGFASDGGVTCTLPTVAPQDSGAFVVPCGNANPDPCICDRPKTDPTAAAECSAKTACEAMGGAWGFGGACTLQQGAQDAGPIGDAGPDGPAH